MVFYLTRTLCRFAAVTRARARARTLVLACRTFFHPSIIIIIPPTLLIIALGENSDIIIPALKRAAASHDGNRKWKRFKMWHDNEAFLKQPLEYLKAG